MNDELSKLYYVHDSLCSWCWGYRPTWLELQAHLPESIVVEGVVGGLAKDTDQPMPLEMQQQIQGFWRQIRDQLGTEFYFDFWTKNQPRRSTFLACRAVIAAANQGCEVEMVEAIQRGYYLRAMNPSERSALVQFAGEIGLDRAQFEGELQSPETEAEMSRQFKLARSLPIDGFPSLVLETGGRVFAIVRDYRDYRTSLADILARVNP